MRRAAPESPPGFAGARVAPMAEGDLDQVLRIEQASFGSPWQRQHFVFEVRHRTPEGAAPGFRRIADVVRWEGRVAAYCCAWFLERELKINNIAVAPECRGSGLGRWLLRDLLARARDAGCTVATLEVRPSNAPARALYRSEGFVEIGRRRNYYAREGEDALLMELPLGESPGV